MTSKSYKTKNVNIKVKYTHTVRDYCIACQPYNWDFYLHVHYEECESPILCSLSFSAEIKTRPPLNSR